MTSLLPWNERVTMLSINPHAASIEDIERLAADLIDANHEAYVKKAEAEVLRRAMGLMWKKFNKINQQYEDYPGCLNKFPAMSEFLAQARAELEAERNGGQS